MRIPPEAVNTLKMVQRQLADSLVAAYLYGSAVSGGLRPDSDVDLLIVTDRALFPEIRWRLVTELMAISGRVGDASTRPIEVTIVQLPELSPPDYPARCEFLYGEWLRADFESGTIPEPARDPDLTLLLAQARQEAMTLVGPDADELLPVIPELDIRRAIGDALPALLESLEGDERNVLLTLARMWHTLETEKFVPKDVAAGWAINQLPAEDAVVLAEARDGYTGNRSDNWQERGCDIGHAVDSLRRSITSAL